MRNFNKFVMSRAARRRGYLSSDQSYNRKALAREGRYFQNGFRKSVQVPW